MNSDDTEKLIPHKKARMDCVIHCTDDDSDLVSLQSLESWKTLYRAAQIRQYLPVLERANDLEEGEVPNGIKYHRKCRCLFTMKRALDNILKHTSTTTSSDNVSEESSTPRKSHRDTPSTSRVYDKICIFCEKASKYIKGQRTREPLIQCVDLRADATIRTAATNRLDQHVLPLLSRDLVAAEGHYHKSCYKLYVKEDTSVITEVHVCKEENSYEEAADKSLKEIISYIRNEVFPNPKILTLTELICRFEDSMRSLGISDLEPSITKKRIRRKLENEFEGNLHFILNGKGIVIIYPDSLSTENLVLQVYDLQNKLKSTRDAINADKITTAAMELRYCIKNHDKDQIWPPDTEISVIPETVQEFIRTLLTGECIVNKDSQRVQRLVTSIGSDLVFAVTAGRIKPPKHILLSYAIKSLTGNVELIQILNRLGHSISRCQYEEIDTALCLQKLELMHNNNTMLVSAHPDVPTTVAWDNIDRLEETLSGGGTSHRVNGIAIQPQVEGPMPQSTKQVAAKTKKRSISVDLPELPSYNAGQRRGPPRTETKYLDTTSEILEAKQKNILWFMSRLFVTDNNFVSSWTGFNIQIRDDITVVQDSITYLPTINAPATQMSTVNEVLEQTLQIMNFLHLEQIVCVFDQALYAKAAEIVWKNEKFKNVVIRMGAFHTICNMLATIGKRFQHAGLGDLCVEAGVLAEGSVAGVMDGRRYNRAVRLHKIVYEALLKLAWKGFYPWLKRTHTAELHCLEDTIPTIEKFQENICCESFQGLLEDEKCRKLLDLFQEYMKNLRDTNSLSAFWLSYLDMVDILLNLIRASREGNWLLHLAAIKEMIPWCFAYDRINYARFLSYYYASMTNLKSDHPEIFAYFMKGGFSVQIGSHNPFGRIPVDQATEETVNKDTQTAGGTRGFSLNSGAVSKYYLTSEYRSRYLKQLREMVDQNESEMCHPDLQVSRIRKDVDDVESVVQLLETSWLNPFSPNCQELVSLSTAVAAPADVAKDLAEAYTIGKEAYKNFREERIEMSAKFFDKMAKNNLKTFSNLVKTARSHSHTKDVVLKADRKLFGQMILVAESRKLQMTEVLSHPLGPLPWALANSDGSLRKTNKAALARTLEKSACPAESIPQPSACIIDGMALVQKIQGNDKTFAQLADSVLNQVLYEGVESSRIDVVFDVYKDMSIKKIERSRRGSDTGIQYKNISPGHKIQQWRKLLCNPDNKTNLIKFLVDEWKIKSRRDRLNEKTLYVTCQQSCFKLTKEHCTEVVELASSQEEADTRLLLHAKHAAESGMKAVIVNAEDTDVMVLCLGFSDKIACPLYQKCGTKNRTKYNDIRKLNNALGERFCEALIGMHAFTGCDTVSAFCGRGKAMTMKMMRSNEAYQEVFRELGCSWDLSNDLFSKLKQITCRMYMASSKTTEVNRLRYQLFCAKRGELDSSQLPPCEDCLFMHSLRANYQTCVWRRCLQANSSPPHPKYYGWKLNDDGDLSVEWMQGLPAPEAVLDLLTCNCSRSCKLPSCTCLNNGLRCTDMCRLQTCSNQAPEQEFNQTIYEDNADDLDDSEIDTDIEDIE